MAKTSLFDFKNYKTYLSTALEKRAELEKGQRSKLAVAMGCQPAYLSQILNGPVDLSPEQAQAANAFLGHTAIEARFFLNLVLWERAGTKELKNYYHEEIQKQLEERHILKNRLQSNRTLSETAQAQYYSSWYYAATHVAVSLGHFSSKELLATALSLPLQTVNSVLEFLVENGLLKKSGFKYVQGERNLFIDASSPFITKHHTNWRMKSIQSLDNIQISDLHYSGVITCSKEDVAKIKEVLIEAIKQVRGTVRESKDETLYVYCLDLFGLLND
ncbi:MAG TPA: TIGR02147 family protein [Bdellovibrio sp.]|nr:TIGR02147 family protein [Bdellovibrio sp.]